MPSATSPRHFATGCSVTIAEGRDEEVGLAAGKLCETVLRLLQQQLTGSYTPSGQHIRDFTSECSRLAQLPATAGNESMRVVIPRALNFVYTLRNKPGALDAEPEGRERRA